VSPIDTEERGSAPADGGEAAWSPEPVLKGPRNRRDRTSIAVALVIGAVAVAVLKPWGMGAPAASGALAAGPTAAILPSTAPQPTPGPVIADPNAMACLTHQVEQVLTLERWPDREIKSWSQADGPVGLAISSSHVVGIGVCPGTGPVAGTGAPAPSRDPLAWSAAVVTGIEVGGATPSYFGPPPQITVQADYVAAGVLYGPPPLPHASPSGSAAAEGSATPLSAWRPGTYGIGYYFPGDPNRENRTITVEITTPLNDN
jgi:hypothetical protein